MGRYTYIGGNDVEIVGGDNKIYSAGDYTQNVGGASHINSIGGTEWSNEVAPPPSANSVSLYVKVRIPDITTYKGEYGFDWIDVDPMDTPAENRRVLNVQGTPFDDVDYFYKQPDTAHPVGQYIQKDTDVRGAQQVILKNYNILEHSTTNGYVDKPFVLIKPGQEITLKLTIHTPDENAVFSDTDVIYIMNNTCYEFTLEEISTVTTNDESKKKDSKRTEVKAKKDGVYNLKIKCLQESPKMNIIIFFTNGMTIATVGGFTMLENKVLKLKFRVIALVSDEGSPTEKAKVLFRDFIETGVEEHLNKHSLNQAGYEVDIENMRALTNLERSELDSYIYAFNAATWRTEGKLFEDKLLFGDIKSSTSDDVKPANPNLTTDVLDGYNNYLKSKRYSTYNEGLIILSDFDSGGGIKAFSLEYPYDFYALFMFSGRREKEIYAHEVGHMLGLNHYFYTVRLVPRTLEEWRLQPVVNSEVGFINGWEEFKERWDVQQGLIQNAIIDEPLPAESISSNKVEAIRAIQNSNKRFEQEINKLKTLDTNPSLVILSKEEELRLEQAKLEEIKTYEDYVVINKKWIKEISKVKYKGYMGFYYPDIGEVTVYYSEFVITYGAYLSYMLSYYKNVHLTFRLSYTYNIMDYGNDGKRKFFSYLQIKTMRADYENYQ